MRTNSGSGRGRGFSLVETMMALVLAGGAMVAALGVIAASARSEAWGERRAIGHTLAAELLAEVCAMGFEQPGAIGSFGRNASEVGATARSTFNDVDDFDGWSETPPRDRDGTSRADLAGWSRSVVVERVSLAKHNGTAVTYDSRVKRVTVTVLFKGVPVANATSIRSSAWDDARQGTYTAAAPVGVGADGVLVDVLDGSGGIIGGLTGLVGGIGGLLGGG